jgi:hypothetical protein
VRTIGNFDEYFPFDLGHGATASSARWRKMAQLWISDGVLANYLNSLSATIAGSTVTLGTGAVFIHGYYAEIQTAQSITVGTNGTIVAKVDYINELCSAYYKDGATDYSSYEQSANNWEIPLWLVSSGTLVDLRVMINPSAGLAWAAAVPTSTPIAQSQSAQINILTPRIPYNGSALLRGEVLVTFPDASQAQSAICQLTYQWGLGDQQTSPSITPSRTGGGPAGVPSSVVAAMSSIIPVTQGKKTVSWRITSGTGTAGVSVSTLTATLTMVNKPVAV